MESLLKGLGDGTLKPEDMGELTANGKEQEKAFEDAWDKILGDVAPSTSTSASAASVEATQRPQKGTEGSFQDRIKQTMDKMKEGESSLKVRNPTTETLQRPYLNSPVAVKMGTQSWRLSCHL